MYEYGSRDTTDKKKKKKKTSKIRISAFII